MNSEFVLTQGSGQKLEFAVNRNGGATTDIDWLSTGENFKSLMLLARGEAELVLKTPDRAQAKLDEIINSIVQVPRGLRPVYPDWVKLVMHPELEDLGPAEFDASMLDQWLHDDQKTGVIGGKKLYEYLKKNKMLESCLGLRDLEEIQKKGVAFFRKYFQGKAVFAWKSVVQDRGGSLRVPYLIESGGEVVVRWRWLDLGWDAYSPALRFAK